MEFSEIGVKEKNLWDVVILISFINIFILLPFIFVGSSHEIIAIVPTIGGFVGGGIITLKERDNIKWQLLGYDLLIVVVILIAIYISWF
jgi:hypothetical protein